MPEDKFNCIRKDLRVDDFWVWAPQTQKCLTYLGPVRNCNLDGRSYIAEASKKVSILRF